MSGRRWLPYIALLVAAASLACSDATSPTTPLQKRTSLSAPTNASFGRYILISGVWTCVESCDDDGAPAPKAEGSSTSPESVPAVPDSIGTDAPPDSASN